jgi:hypothetical protein
MNCDIANNSKQLEELKEIIDEENTKIKCMDSNLKIAQNCIDENTKNKGNKKEINNLKRHI